MGCRGVGHVDRAGALRDATAIEMSAAGPQAPVRVFGQRHADADLIERVRGGHGFIAMPLVHATSAASAQPQTAEPPKGIDATVPDRGEALAVMRVGRFLMALAAGSLLFLGGALAVEATTTVASLGALSFTAVVAPPLCVFGAAVLLVIIVALVNPALARAEAIHESATK